MPIKKQRLRISNTLEDDDWLLGVIAAKTGLRDAFKTNRFYLEPKKWKKRKDETLDQYAVRMVTYKHRLEAFNKGYEDAPKCKMIDILEDLWVVRKSAPRFFDLKLHKAIGKVSAKCLIKQIKDFHKTARTHNRVHEAALSTLIFSTLN